MHTRMQYLLVNDDLSSESDPVAHAQQEWLKTVICFLSNSVGIAVSYYVEEKVAIFSMCVLGSKYAVDAFHGLVREFVLAPLRLDVEKSHQLAARMVAEVLFLALVGAGIVVHVRYTALLGLDEGSWTRLALWPVFWFEELVHSGRLQ